MKVRARARRRDRATLSMTQAVWLSCPRCRRRWLGGMVEPDAWWSAGVTPQKIATLWYCPHCDARPPMRVIEQE